MSGSLDSFPATRVASAALALSVLAIGAAAPASAQSPRGEIQRGFELIDDFVVVVNGEDSPGARIYRSSQTSAILIMPEQVTDPPVLVWPRQRVVESLNFMKVQRLAGGFLEVKTDPVIATHDPFEVVGTNVVFKVADNELRLKPKPPLIGLYDADAMLEKSAVYARRAEAYEPSQEVLDRLGQTSSNVRVRIFFGTWCPACGQMVPRILNVAQRLEDTGLSFEFYGLPRGFKGDTEAAKYGVHSVPTGVIFVEEREVGRIEGNDWRQPEAALWNLIGS
ncbi:MAG: thioredoxin family protein [Thermoanaerobaculia bacterium]